MLQIIYFPLQITPMHQTTPMHRPMGVTPKVEPGTGQENRVTEVLKRHFKGEPGVAEKGADDPFNLKKVGWILMINLLNVCIQHI